MALLFHPNIRNLMLGKGIMNGFSNPCAISVYQGAQPVPNDIIANWSTTYASTNAAFLVHYTGASWSQPSQGLLLQLGIPLAQNGVNTGTATWAICWATNVSAANVAASTIPSTSFIVVPCSDSIGAGVIRFADPIVTAGVSKVILDGSIGATM